MRQSTKSGFERFILITNLILGPCFMSSFEGIPVYLGSGLEEFHCILLTTGINFSLLTNLAHFLFPFALIVTLFVSACLQ